MLRCRTINGHSYLLSDISLSCETPEYLSHKSVAIFGVLVFPVGITLCFTTLVAYNRSKLPPDWWPMRAPQEATIAHQKYRSTRTEPKSFAVWKADTWDPQMARFDKFYKRFGFLFFGACVLLPAVVLDFYLRASTSLHCPLASPPSLFFNDHTHWHWQLTTRTSGGLSPCSYFISCL